MRRIRRAFILLAITLAAGLHAAGDGDTAHDAESIVRTIDELYRSASSRARVRMRVVTPHWERTLEMRVWTGGLDKTFIRILSPRKERGVGTLRIGDEMWNYLPKVNKVIKVPPSMMMSSWMGSDFTNDDLVKEFTFVEDYRFTLLGPSDANSDWLVLECLPKEGRPIVWSKVTLVVRARDYLPVRQKYYDDDGGVVRVLEFSEIGDLGGRRLPQTLTMVPKSEKGHRTVITYEEAEFNVDIEPQIFSLRHLRRQP